MRKPNSFGILLYIFLYVPFSLQIETMMGKLKLEKISVCAISYLGSALALRHRLKRIAYSSHKW